jgi:hypothetical protein
MVGDFDGDGRSEVAVGGQPTRGIDVAELDGSASSWSETFTDSPAETVVGDFDGDGDDDIATMTAFRAWTGYRSNGSGFVSENWGRHSGKPWEHFMVGDFDGDGSDEVVAFHPPTGGWWLSNLTSTGWAHVSFAKYNTISGWQSHVVGDSDGDGREEILSFHPSNGTWWSTGLGEKPRLVTNLATNSGWLHLTAIDVDADGVDELVQYHPSNGTWWKTDPSDSGARVSLWTKFNTKNGWEHPTTLGGDTLAIRHRGTGNIYAIIGEDGILDYLGRMLPGSLEGFWRAELDGTPALVALQRD